VWKSWCAHTPNQRLKFEVRVNEVRATFRFPEHNLPKLREIANNWAERGYINAKHLLMRIHLQKEKSARLPISTISQQGAFNGSH
jgi:hypothetical protein